MAQEKKKSKVNREILAVALLVVGLLLALSLASFSPRDRSFNTPSGSLSTALNWGGPAGAFAPPGRGRSPELPPSLGRGGGEGSRPAKKTGPRRLRGAKKNAGGARGKRGEQKETGGRNRAAAQRDQGREGQPGGAAQKNQE